MSSKKLLVLDVNGLLVDTYFHKEPLPDESPHARVGSFYVYKRPFCEEFLRFCLDNFTVGIWSSAREYNVNNLVDYVFGDTKEKLAFTWHQSDCTDVGLKSPDNQRKPLFLKELSKLWRKIKVDLPWTEGDYVPSNTLLVDDTPYKAILNPPNTAIFPRSYTARDHGDNFLGGALRSYLEGIRDAASVQTYVESNPFGEPSITPASPLWSYVSEVVLKVKSVLNKVGDGIAQIMPVETVSDEGNKEDKPKRWQNRKGKHYSDPLQPVEAVSDESNKEDKPKRWRNRKRKHHLDPSQLANIHTDFDFPSEAVELQSSELHSSDSTLQPLGSGVSVHDSTSPYQQVHETANLGSQEIVDMPLDQTERVCSHLNQPDQKGPSQVGKGISLPLGLEEWSKDEHQDRNSLFTELGNCEQAANSKQGDLKGVGKEHQEENQANSIHHENESFEKSRIPVGYDGLNSSKPDCMQGESNNEKLLCGRRDMMDNSYVRASNNNYGSQQHLTYSNRTWHKHRGTWEEQNKWHSQRHYTNRGSFRYGHGWKSEGGYRQDGRKKMPFSKGFDQRGHQFVNKQHIKYVDRHNSGEGYFNRNKPSFGYARHSQKRWGDRPVDAPAQFALGPPIPDSRSWDQSQQDCRQFSNTEASTNASFGVVDSNSSTQPFNNASTQPYNSQRDMAGRVTEYSEFGRGQDGSYSWHQGFDEGAAYERSNVWPERLNVNLHNPDNGKRQRFDIASKEAGASSQLQGNTRAFRQPYRGQNGASRQPYQNAEASSQLYRSAGAFSQPYRGQQGASRQPYQNVGASNQPYHNKWDKYRQGLEPGGSFRSRQSQEGRNL